MPFLLSLLVAVFSIALGACCGGVLGDYYIRWMRIQSGQGIGGFYYVVATGFYGAIAGLAAGIIAAVVMSPQNWPGFGKTVAVNSGVAVVVTLAWLGVLRLFAHIPPTIDGRRLTLEVEFRLPAGEDKPVHVSTGGDHFSLDVVSAGSTRRRFGAIIALNDAREDSGRWIIPGRVAVESSRGSRALSVTLNGREEPGGFQIPLPAAPGREHLEWSGWLPATAEAEAGSVGKKLTYRFRVQQIVTRDLKKEESDRRSQEFAASKAELDSVPADAPVKDFLRFTRFGPPEAIKPLAMARMVAKSTFATEMQAMMLADDANLSREVLWLVQFLPKASPDLLRAVEAAGRDIAERIRKVNATPVKDDPDFDGAKDVATRFEAWIRAVAKLRAKDGGDFVPELKTILELSRVRKDSAALQQDVCRVASHALHDWAGIRPLPTDPKLR